MKILQTRAVVVVKYLKCKNRLQFIEYVGKREIIGKEIFRAENAGFSWNQVIVQFGLIITLSEAHIGKQVGHMLINSFVFFSCELWTISSSFCNIKLCENQILAVSWDFVICFFFSIWESKYLEIYIRWLFGLFFTGTVRTTTFQTNIISDTFQP